MKAVICTQYGPPEVLQLAEVAKPVPKDNEVLIKIHATTAHVGDARIRRFDVPRWQWLLARLMLGIRGPRNNILGFEAAGVIEAVGGAVTRFKVGDAVFAMLFPGSFGGYAEYKCMPEDGLIAIKPANVSFDEAAAVPGGGMTALTCLKKADIQPGQKVLIYGASGSVGTFAVQLAKVSGAEVVGVCSTANLDLVRSIGADQVMDHKKEDFTRGGPIYDVVFDAVDKLESSHGKKALKPGGVYLNVAKDSEGGGNLRKERLNYLAKLMETGQLKPVIDRTYPLEDIVEAHRYVETGRKKGNVVITVTPR